MFDVLIDHRANTDDFEIYVSERIGDRVYIIEPAADGMVARRLLVEDSRRLPGEARPLWRMNRSISNELFPALVQELAKLGFRAADPQEGALAVTKDALADARTTRDRLLSIVERK